MSNSPYAPQGGTCGQILWGNKITGENEWISQEEYQTRMEKYRMATEKEKCLELFLDKANLRIASLIEENNKLVLERREFKARLLHYAEAALLNIEKCNADAEFLIADIIRLLKE